MLTSRVYLVALSVLAAAMFTVFWAHIAPGTVSAASPNSTPQPVHFEFRCTGGSGCSQEFTVSAGRRLFVQHVSILVDHHTTATPAASLIDKHWTPNGCAADENYGYYAIPLVRRGGDTAETISIASHQMLAFIDADPQGCKPEIRASWPGGLSAGGMTRGVITGYTVSAE